MSKRVMAIVRSFRELTGLPEKSAHYTLPRGIACRTLCARPSTETRWRRATYAEPVIMNDMRNPSSKIEFLFGDHLFTVEGREVACEGIPVARTFRGQLRPYQVGGKEETARFNLALRAATKRA